MSVLLKGDRDRTVRRDFASIQALRGVAVLLVMLYHGNWNLSAIDPRHDPRVRMYQGLASGVDIFFIISGFVMITSNLARRGEAASGGNFMKRRLERIVPLYWLVTTLALLIHATAPFYSIRPYLGLGQVAASYLFIPAFEVPIVPPGWTLTAEMLFYLLFAVALWCRVRPMILATLILFGLALLHPLAHHSLTAASLTQEVMLEFAFGMGLAHLVAAGYRLRSGWAWLLLLVGTLALLSGAHGHHLWRSLYWGVPALGIVAGAVSLESSGRTRMPGWLLILGNASYSLYLVHMLVVWILTGIVLRHGWHGALVDALFLVVYLASATTVGLLCYRHVELPMIRYFRRKRSVHAMQFA